MMKSKQTCQCRHHGYFMLAVQRSLVFQVSIVAVRLYGAKKLNFQRRVWIALAPCNVC